MAEPHITEALSLELQDVAGDIAQMLAPLQAPDAAFEQVEHSSRSAAQAVSRFVDATGFCDMPGLKDLAQFLERNLQALPRLSSERRETVLNGGRIERWVSLLLEFLGAPSSTEPLDQLLASSAAAGWHEPMDAEQASTLRATVIAECMEATPDDMQASVAQVIAALDAEQTRVEFPDDVSAHLKDTFLLEAPERTARLTATVQLLNGTEASLETLAQAQRLAHTIKGSANITGVRGLANLAHWTEAMLERLREVEQLPSHAECELLLEAADCLEMMVECLQEERSAPDSSLDILRRLIGAEARARGTGEIVPEVTAARVAAVPEPPAPRPMPPAAPMPASEPIPDSLGAAEPAFSQTVGGGVRVPLEMVDRLLNIAGEIATELVQIRGHQANATRRTALQRDHESILQQRLTSLQDLVSVGGTSTRGTGTKAAPGFDPLEMDQYNEMHSSVNAFVETVTDWGEFTTGLADDLGDVDRLLLKQEQLSKELNDLAVSIRTVSVQTIMPRLTRCVRQTCRSTGKQAQLEIEGGDLSVDTELLSRVVDPLMHMIRNAVDHGIEPPDVRIARGKEPEGTVTLQFGREGESIVVSCHDDGAGYDLKRLRAVAEERGLVAAGVDLDANELIRLSLVPGFSTREDVTQISGRGIGLDVVETAVQDMRGRLDIDSPPGMGTTITLRVPLTLISMHVLLVRALGQVFGIPSRILRQSLFSDAGELYRDVHGTLCFRVDGESYVVRTLNELVGIPRTEPEPDVDQTLALLLMRSSEGATAICVDEAVDGKYLVVQRLGDFVPRVRAVVGASITQDGLVAPILDLGELIRQPAEFRVARDIDLLADRNLNKPSVLVVDDSLSARRTLAEIIGDAGYEVSTAIDGLDAIDVMEDAVPDLVILDLEMPNMNGLELAQHIRAETRSRRIPLLMITSRATVKHHERARAAGVDEIIVKPWQEDELIEQVQHLLAQAP